MNTATHQEEFYFVLHELPEQDGGWRNYQSYLPHLNTHIRVCHSRGSARAIGDNAVIRYTNGQLIAAAIDGFPIFYGGTIPYLPDPKTGLALATDEWASRWVANQLAQEPIKPDSELLDMLSPIDYEMGNYLQENHGSILKLASQVPGVVGAFLQVSFNNEDNPQLVISHLGDTCYVIETIDNSIIVSPPSLQYHESLDLAAFQFFKEKNGGHRGLAWIDYNRNFYYQLRDIDVNNPDIPQGFGAINGQSWLQFNNIEGFQKRNFKSFFNPVYYPYKKIKRVLLFTDGGISKAHLGITENTARELIHLADTLSDFRQIICRNREYIEHDQHQTDTSEPQQSLPEATYLELKIDA